MLPILAAILSALQIAFRVRPVQIVLFVFIYGVNEHKEGQFEPAGLGKLIEKQFNLCM
jgi:hypothetical protein